ncbi:MAG TPA: hypothetical protein VLT89_10065 [Usitatibacter sp.]|nr:hypothetical protein [Usitatibacter sp.]
MLLVCILKRILALLTAMSCLGAGATSFGTDYSDLWWNASENGEGFNVIQQEDILLMTFFVYDASNKPTWYVSPDTAYNAEANNFQGPLYDTQGPPGSSLGATQVGTAVFSPMSSTTATLTYTVNGASIVKALTRETWRNDDMSGSYIGAKIGTYSGSGCNYGYMEEPVTMVVGQAAQTVTYQFTFSGNSCSQTGTYTQAGRMGSVNGTFSCSNGASGSFSQTEIQVTPQGVAWRGTASTTYDCSWTGHIGGVRQAP